MIATNHDYDLEKEQTCSITWVMGETSIWFDGIATRQNQSCLSKMWLTSANACPEIPVEKRRWMLSLNQSIARKSKVLLSQDTIHRDAHTNPSETIPPFRKENFFSGSNMNHVNRGLEPFMIPRCHGREFSRELNESLRPIILAFDMHEVIEKMAMLQPEALWCCTNPPDYWVLAPLWTETQIPT
jgi:hypothetical protein